MNQGEKLSGVATAMSSAAKTHANPDEIEKPTTTIADPCLRKSGRKKRVASTYCQVFHPHLAAH